MVCYMVPLLAAFAHQVARKKMKRMNENDRQHWLTLMLLGGGSFGAIDHLWSGELLLGSNLLADLALGALITLGIVGAWAIAVIADRISTGKPAPSE